MVKGQGDTALLSREAAERMGLVEYHLDLTLSMPSPLMGESRQSTVDLIEEYQDVFSGLGKLKGLKVKLHVDPRCERRGTETEEDILTPQRQVRSDPQQMGGYGHH